MRPLSNTPYEHQHHKLVPEPIIHQDRKVLSSNIPSTIVHVEEPGSPPFPTYYSPPATSSYAYFKNQQYSPSPNGISFEKGHVSHYPRQYNNHPFLQHPIHAYPSSYMYHPQPSMHYFPQYYHMKPVSQPVHYNKRHQAYFAPPPVSKEDPPVLPPRDPSHHYSPREENIHFKISASQPKQSHRTHGNAMYLFFFILS